MSGVAILQKPGSGSYIVEQRKSVIQISKPDGGTRINISNPFLFKVTHEMLANTGPSGDPIATPRFDRNNNHQKRSFLFPLKLKWPKNKNIYDETKHTSCRV